ncbi:peroxiredoxin [Aliifodinibius salipaludis]|uniref:Peroxiredoxin n=1 Tax=Fodinibius salipaludis TaxID=2032627 RepID=A0A2A2GAN0_9BACT|nr:OsmC family protein [Aliifodinibius salipaludis]PAU93907.1 peroxiredoxin [Aliifodinibius salipaludis]
MAKYITTVSWSRDGQSFTDNQYKRVHQWEFDSGQTIRASASPDIVPVPLSDPSAVDPEEAFVAALSSCHMLWFLSIAAEAGFVVEQYVDKATGILSKDEQDKQAITQVTLFPHVSYKYSDAPSVEEHHNIHELADEKCFIANSVKTKVEIESSMSNKPM